MKKSLERILTRDSDFEDRISRRFEGCQRLVQRTLDLLTAIEVEI